MYFFRERTFFTFHLKNNIIFSGKRNIIFPDDTRKIIFQCYLFRKTIFSEHLEKENMVFRGVIAANPFVGFNGSIPISKALRVNP